ncbi:PIR protein [Plasmodium yoelii]|uniref:PIR protein n=2 Tax=Plasmodium yoelii TaxID=5861 RepID=A0AAE9WTM8_PLAYO|nr:PIR protein [Plasmodium yoelii]WBY58269.1 PIR protein [Plasmodium yoelii yoelii]CDS44882.1 YIR protein [Plasmodium yoelii]VTZ79188.1 PIR protein [Plasmodium yoelii]|eukprot:XP_022811160.1 PIR protein [Plasmodium yoelii]
MNVEVCKRFKNVWEDFPDKLVNEKYHFNDDKLFKTYCTNNCTSYINKMNAGFLYFFNEFFGNSSVFESVAKSNINIVEYIMIWLSYMFNLKKDNSINTIDMFYSNYIDNNKYKNSIYDAGAYNSYDDLINKKKELMNMKIKDISKFYDPFKLLCEMYNEFDENKKDCTQYSEKAKQFVEKYEKLNGDPNNTDDSSYKQLLCTLSTDYDNFKKKCNDSSSLPTIDKTKIPEKCSKQISGHISEVTSSSSSIASKLIPVLSIIVAVAILLGISYKYSLCGIRKRAQKHLREKLKK